MSRLPELDPAKFSPEQKKVHDGDPRRAARQGGRADQGVAEQSGPRRACAGARRLCRFNSSLPPRLSELAICITGAFWKANYEWFAHAPMAIKAGIDPAAIEAIRTGATPKFTKSDEQAIYDFAIELVTAKRVSNATFERAKKEIGETSVIDLVGIIGYYSLVSVTLNAFELPLPEGEKLPFDISERVSLSPLSLRCERCEPRRAAELH